MGDVLYHGLYHVHTQTMPLPMPGLPPEKRPGTTLLAARARLPLRLLKGGRPRANRTCLPQPLKDRRPHLPVNISYTHTSLNAPSSSILSAHPSASSAGQRGRARPAGGRTHTTASTLSPGQAPTGHPHSVVGHSFRVLVVPHIARSADVWLPVHPTASIFGL